MPTYPYLEFALTIGTWDLVEEACPDTGFEGGLAIPAGMGEEIIADPGLRTLRTADGSLHRVPTWRGRLYLHEHSFEVEVVAIGNAYLIGREVLDQLKICFEWGRQVRLEFRD